MSVSKSIFTTQFDKITREIPFNPQWANGTGYFNYAIQGENAVKLEDGELAKSTARDGRRMIFVGTCFGPVVVFDRYSNRNDIQVFNTTREVESFKLFAQESNSLDDRDVAMVVGHPDDFKKDNLGKILNRIVSTALAKISEEML